MVSARCSWPRTCDLDPAGSWPSSLGSIDSAMTPVAQLHYRVGRRYAAGARSEERNLSTQSVRIRL